jgi:magnesium transporter
VHYIELDQFVGPEWLITVHGPLNPVVRPEVATEETRAVARRLDTGRLRPTSAAELSYAVVTALTGRMRDLLSTLTEEVQQLEREVTAGWAAIPPQGLVVGGRSSADRKWLRPAGAARQDDRMEDRRPHDR